MNPVLWVAGPLIGFIGMMSGGYWGVGCGWIVTPTMLMLGFSPLQAVGIGLLQMVIPTLPTVIRQFSEIGWGAHSVGRLLAIPLVLGAILTSLVGKPINTWLIGRFGSAPLGIMLCIVIMIIAVQTLCSRTKSYGDALPDPSLKMAQIAFGTGLVTGLVSSLLGVGGGIITRPILTSGFKVPEYYTSRIVRLTLLLTTTVGGITYLIRSGKIEQEILLSALLVATGGFFGFPLGAKLHKIVYDAGYAQYIHKSFAVIALALLLNFGLNLVGFKEASRITMLGIGVALSCYLISFAIYAKAHPRPITPSNPPQ